MQTIDDPGDALAVLHDPGFVVPPVPAATHGVAWLRATVGRFSSGEVYTRRRAISETLLSTVDSAALREAAASSPHAHPVQLLATALRLDSSARTIDAVSVVAAAYQPGTGDETAADAAVRVLVEVFGGPPDELTAARIGVLVQASAATAALIARARGTDLDTALRATPPVPATRRMATRPADLGGIRVEAGEVVRVSLHGIPFGAGPRICPGRAHALALAEGALTAAAAASEVTLGGGALGGGALGGGALGGGALGGGGLGGGLLLVGGLMGGGGGVLDGGGGLGGGGGALDGGGGLSGAALDGGGGLGGGVLDGGGGLGGGVLDGGGGLGGGGGALDGGGGLGGGVLDGGGGLGGGGGALDGGGGLGGGVLDGGGGLGGGGGMLGRGALGRGAPDGGSPADGALAPGALGVVDGGDVW